ncbi:unnamed protein product [Peniophora sp. CBMAI 1063]|nr:unnamed protein product [Peniophora sp. CBMAI 1063]
MPRAQKEPTTRKYFESFRPICAAVPPRPRVQQDKRTSSDMWKKDSETLDTLRHYQAEYIQQANMSTAPISVMCLKDHPAAKRYLYKKNYRSTAIVKWEIEAPPEPVERTICVGSAVVLAPNTEIYNGYTFWPAWIKNIYWLDGIQVVDAVHMDSLAGMESALKNGQVAEPKRLKKQIARLRREGAKDNTLILSNEEETTPVHNIVAACTEQEHKSIWDISTNYRLSVTRRKYKSDYNIIPI